MSAAALAALREAEAADKLSQLGRALQLYEKAIAALLRDLKSGTVQAAQRDAVRALVVKALDRAEALKSLQATRREGAALVRSQAERARERVQPPAPAPPPGIGAATPALPTAPRRASRPAAETAPGEAAASAGKPAPAAAAAVPSGAG
eukprot:SAG22_NODE_6653_length_826_cov_2.515818_1_plen_148_part_01